MKDDSSSALAFLVIILIIVLCGYEGYKIVSQYQYDDDGNYIIKEKNKDG